MALVLIVDDEFAIAELLSAMIEDDGLRVMIASEGRAALAIMATSLPDLVFTDTMMPIMSGPALVQAMERDPVLSGVPLVAMSALPEAEVGSRYVRYSVFLRKPFGLTDITRLLSGLLAEN